MRPFTLIIVIVLFVAWILVHRYIVRTKPFKPLKSLLFVAAIYVATIAGLWLSLKIEPSTPAPKRECAAAPAPTPAPAPAPPTINPGDEMTASERHSASVYGLDPATGKFDKMCLFREHDGAIVLAAHGDYLLVRYRRSSAYDGGKFECRDGSLMMIGRDLFLDYRKIQADLEREQREEGATLAYLNAVARGEKPAATDDPKVKLGVGSKVESAPIVELAGFPPGRECLAGWKGTLTPLAARGGLVLARYSAEGSDDHDLKRLKLCADGATVIIDQDKFLLSEDIRESQRLHDEAAAAFRRWAGDHPGAGR